MRRSVYLNVNGILNKCYLVFTDFMTVYTVINKLLKSSSFVLFMVKQFLSFFNAWRTKYEYLSVNDVDGLFYGGYR